VKPSRKKLIISLSILIPVVVASLFGIHIKTETDFSFLPRIYATINFFTFFILIAAYVSIKKYKNQRVHAQLIGTALASTFLFLILYIIYHITSESTHYGGSGALMYLYYFILISHITLSVLVIPLVLITLGFALDKNFKKHKKIARIAMPIWMYVAFTGVLVYLLISPYYH